MQKPVCQVLRGSTGRFFHCLSASQDWHHIAPDGLPSTLMWRISSPITFGPWEGQYVYQKEHRSIYGLTQEEVSQQLDEIIASIENENYIRPNQHTLVSWLRKWLHTYAKPTLRPATFTNYEVNIERHFNTGLGKVKLKNVSTRMLQKFFNEKLVSGGADKKPGGLGPKH